MKKRNRTGGFTLAELLIVIAIIAILVAIAIPVFTVQLRNAKTQVDAANTRIALSVAQSNYSATGCVISACGGQACKHNQANGGYFDVETGTIVATMPKNGYNKAPQGNVDWGDTIKATENDKVVSVSVAVGADAVTTVWVGTNTAPKP